MPAAVSTLVLAPTPDSARVQLRNALASYFHAQPTAAPAGYSRWAAPATQAVNQPPRLLVGDPVTLMVSPFFSPSIPHLTPPKKKQENLKILKQYTKLLSQACRERDTLQAAHAQPLSPTPATYPRNLQWFEHLARPYQELDEASSARITKLLQLHAACDKSVPALPRLQAYELAKSLPHFDRDLTAYYLALPPNTAREYELHVAHSIMRLHSPATPEDLRRHLATWRHQGLLHVLSVAALNMPDLADWFPVDTPSPDKIEEACSLHECLAALHKTPGDYARTIQDFIATQDPASATAQHIASTLDRLAVLMSVKSNASDEPGHDLAAALQALPRLDSLEPQDVWARIRPALELALPPSLLQLDPACAKKRVKHAQGTW
jgi:hypothetical protein